MVTLGPGGGLFSETPDLGLTVQFDGAGRATSVVITTPYRPTAWEGFDRRATGRR